MKNGINNNLEFQIERLPKSLQQEFLRLYQPSQEQSASQLAVNAIHHGDALNLLDYIKSNSIALSFWSPPYFVGKQYENHLNFDDWKELLRLVMQKHFSIVKPGGFLVINIADILCFKDPKMPKIQAEVVHRKRSIVTKELILKTWAQHPDLTRYQIAEKLGCSEQTIDRRLNGNNIRGGKYEIQTRVKIVGGMLEQWAIDAGFYPYDRRIWVKDAAWENSRWANLSYRSVDEFEYLYFFWKPGVTRFDRNRLTPEEWKNWGSRAVWKIPSVRANNDHEAKFPIELPLKAIQLLTDSEDIVLDCFIGSGTTAVAAVRSNRQYIGIELDQNYAMLAEANVQREILQQSTNQLGLCF